MLGSVALLITLFLSTRLGQLQLLTWHFLYRQDIWVCVALVAALLGLSVLRPKSGTSPIRVPLLNNRILALIALAIVLLCIAGFRLILMGHDLSRDEQMAIFDAKIFASGHLAGTIPGEWVSLRTALNTVFIDPALTGTAWGSVYRPVNAILHAIGELFEAAHIVGPLMAGAAIWLTWRCSRYLWPEDNGAQWVTIIMLALSAQFILTGMTTYAMTPLLTFNMAWLLLVWRDGKWSHAGALAIGFFATGLHQVLYHPLFAFPVAFMFLLQRRWGLAAFYALAYPAFILFWMAFTGIRADILLPGASEQVAQGGSAAGALIPSGIALLNSFGIDAISVKAANLMRLFSWQHLLFLPLLIAGVIRAWRMRDSRLIVLVAIVALAVVAKLLLRPYQGHGWGYRYMHGALGAMVLLGGAGWIELRERGIANAKLFLLASAATVAVLLPARAYQAHSFTKLYADPAIAARGNDAEVVIVDDMAAPFAQDIVLNDPFLSTRPVYLASSVIPETAIADLCRRYRVMVIDYRALQSIRSAYGNIEQGEPDPKVEHIIAGDYGCEKVSLFIPQR